jgi:hypothetical protein
MRSTTHLSTREFSPKPGHRKPAVVAAPEPVDVEDLRQLAASPSLLAHRRSSAEVVAGVVADERQHRHRVAAHHADLPVAAAVVSDDSVAPRYDAVNPVARLGDQRIVVRRRPAEEDRVDRDARRVVVLGREDRALVDRLCRTGVRMARQLTRVGRPVVALPVDEVRGRLAHALPPDVAVVGAGHVGEDTELPLRQRAAFAFGLVLQSVPGATPNSPYSGFVA